MDIDHPTLAGQTLVQVRALGKPLFPGCFDMPAGGHVVGLETNEEAVLKELAEELGLAPDDVEGLAVLGALTITGCSRTRLSLTSSSAPPTIRASDPVAWRRSALPMGRWPPSPFLPCQSSGF